MESVRTSRTEVLPALLRESTLAALLDDRSRAISLVDREGCLLFANDLFHKAQGTTSRDSLGRHLGEVASNLWAHLEPHFPLLRGGRAVEIERTSVRADCPSAPQEWSERWQAIRDEHGQVVGILGVAVDVTERRAEREEQERIADLRGRLIETASHELRGPLASVLGFAHRLTRDEHLSPAAAEAAQLIREQAQELAFRLDLFLGVSELDGPSGLHAPSIPPVEDVLIDDLLEREAEAMRARRPGIALDVHCPDGLTIASNPHYIRQILANLLDNAAKYGSGWIGVIAERGERHLVIRVEDDGDGITAAEQEEVFERGYRGASTRTTSAGRGLGLFVAREFAERLGGALTLRSEAGVGTTFLLRIPLQSPKRQRRRRDRV
jgi:PAS domain S-box-containing protein